MTRAQRRLRTNFPKPRVRCHVQVGTYSVAQGLFTAHYKEKPLPMRLATEYEDS